MNQDFENSLKLIPFGCFLPILSISVCIRAEKRENQNPVSIDTLNALLFRLIQT